MAVLIIASKWTWLRTCSQRYLSTSFTLFLSTIGGLIRSLDMWFCGEWLCRENVGLCIQFLGASDVNDIFVCFGTGRCALFFSPFFSLSLSSFELLCTQNCECITGSDIELMMWQINGLPCVFLSLCSAFPHSVQLLLVLSVACGWVRRVEQLSLSCGSGTVLRVCVEL